MGKRRRMRRSPRGAHKVAITRAAALDGRISISNHKIAAKDAQLFPTPMNGSHYSRGMSDVESTHEMAEAFSVSPKRRT